MKIRYKKKRLYSNLLIGIVWCALGLFLLTEDEKLRWSDYGYLVIGILYIGRYLYSIANQYLTIENGKIQKDLIFGRKMNLSEIIWIKSFAGEYILKTEKQELKINTELIDENSLAELKRIFGQLELPSDKTPFINGVK